MLKIESVLPDRSIAQFVHSFWMVENNTTKDVPSTVLPNGMADMILMKKGSGNWKIVMRGIDTIPGEVTITADTKLFSIGFKLLAVEYVHDVTIKELLNNGKAISNDPWLFEEKDLKDLKAFSNKATQRIRAIAATDIDSRKKRLFDLLYASHGNLTVKELSDESNWSTRQINRYFNQRFGISLKTYCNILRFGASFKHISEGKLFPEQNFTDQNHFIKEIKKYAGVTPKELRKNEDDRYIDIVAIKKLPPMKNV